MNNRRRTRTLNELADLTRLIQRDHTRAINQLDQWTAGYPTGNTDTPNATIPTGQAEPDPDNDNPLDYTDRTGTLATSRPDPFAHHQHELDRLITLAHTAITDAYQHMLVGLARREATQTTIPCRSCHRLTEPHTGRPLFTPAWRADLCRWCADWQTRHGAWPAEQILRAHHRGEAITERMVRRYQRAS